MITEQDILTGCVNNNAASQQLLYDMYSAKMLAVCYRYAKNRADAEDMLQEGFIKVLTQIKQYRQEGSLEGWIRRVVAHTCINILKRNKKFSDNVDILHATALANPNDDMPSVMLAKQIVDCIRLLPMGYRTVLNLYAVEGYSHKEIGTLLDIGESTSRSQYTRAKLMLQNILIKRKIITDEYITETRMASSFKAGL